MIRRSSKEFIDRILDSNPNWRVLDIGCGYSAHKNASVVCDIEDLSSFYKDKIFIKLSDKILPFKDKEFDFVISSHVIEHVQDVAHFIKELERVSSKGYIELPTMLEDNLVFENKKDHIWHMQFDDDNLELIVSNRIQFLEPILTVSSAKKLSKYFRQSMFLELFWENSIEFKIKKINEEEFEKLSRLTLFRKFLSKLLRNIIK